MFPRNAIVRQIREIDWTKLRDSTEVTLRKDVGTKSTRKSFRFELFRGRIREGRGGWPPPLFFLWRSTRSVLLGAGGLKRLLGFGRVAPRQKALY